MAFMVASSRTYSPAYVRARLGIFVALRCIPLFNSWLDVSVFVCCVPGRPRACRRRGRRRRRRQGSAAPARDSSRTVREILAVATGSEFNRKGVQRHGCIFPSRFSYHQHSQIWFVGVSFSYLDLGVGFPWGDESKCHLQRRAPSGFFGRDAIAPILLRKTE
jgi:hypothetical protein